jgi:RimJ/RimL family protein N-acetyltransferase
MNWIEHPLALHGQEVDLLPLKPEMLEDLYRVAADPRLWTMIPYDASKRDTFMRLFNESFADREADKQYPFVVFHKKEKRLIGSTRYINIAAADKALEIGWTWYAAEWWGTKVNPECKLMLLRCAFGALGARRVQIKTDERNIRSRKAIEKIGGRFEGILRKDRILESGLSRNTAYYSIIDEEWPEAEQRITALVAAAPAGPLS